MRRVDPLETVLPGDWLDEPHRAGVPPHPTCKETVDGRFVVKEVEKRAIEGAPG
jgi:hypothetical protein